MEAFECKICNEKFKAEESLEQHNKAKHFGRKEDNKISKNRKKYFLLAVVLIAIVVFSLTLYLRSLKPGKYEGFANCLKDKAIIYGNDFCSYTNQQMNMFGKAKKLLNYIKCIDNEELCNSKRVKITPTWEINGEMYEGVQGFEKLAALTGCEV